MKRLLVAGGSHSDIPLINAAKDLGYYVITTGNKSEDKGHQFSDQHILEDFSDKDAILKIAKKLNIDVICSSSNDFSVITCAYVAECLSLPGFDNYTTTLQLHHKDKFKYIAEEIELPRVNSLIIDISKDPKFDLSSLRFPLLIKPVDLTGGKGISKIKNIHELRKAIEFAISSSRLNRVVIEDFFEGSLHSYSTFIKNKKVIFEYADNEFSYLNPYLVSTSTSPAAVSEFVLKQMRKYTEKLARKLHLVDGILHAQFLANGDSIRIIEYTRRMPGDFYSIPVKMSTGLDQAKIIIELCAGVPIEILKEYYPTKFVSRHCAMADKVGVFAGIEIANEISEKITKKFYLKEPGEHIVNPMVDKTAIYFLEYESKEEMNFLNKMINQLIKVKIC